MKKALLLSVVASTMIMAGGDIAPVEPVVEAPAVVSGWDFSGQAVAYYQTAENGISPWNKRHGEDLFSADAATGNLGLQLRAINKDVAYGIGAGFELTGLSEFPFDITNSFNQKAGRWNQSGAFMSQAYLTYGVANTSFKIGRQELPKALSPFAFSEGWNVFKNTFDAALIVNTDLTDTTLVYAFVQGANSVKEKMHKFEEINDDGVHMLTAQNKSVEGLTLTGTWYYAPDMAGTDAVNVLWADAKFAISNINVGLQGGSINSSATGYDDTSAYGAKLGYAFDMFDASVAYSSVDDGQTFVANLGTGVKTPLYTQMVGNQDFIKTDSNTLVLRAGMKALNGKFGVAYGISDIGEAKFGDRSRRARDYTELDVTYKTTIGATTLFAAYVLQDESGIEDLDVDNSIIRLWAKYNF